MLIISSAYQKQIEDQITNAAFTFIAIFATVLAVYLNNRIPSLYVAFTGPLIMGALHAIDKWIIKEDPSAVIPQQPIVVTEQPTVSSTNPDGTTDQVPPPATEL